MKPTEKDIDKIIDDVLVEPSTREKLKKLSKETHISLKALVGLIHTFVRLWVFYWLFGPDRDEYMSPTRGIEMLLLFENYYALIITIELFFRAVKSRIDLEYDL
jgi:hypothetical protein